MLDHQIPPPQQSISWCIVLRGAGGPLADLAAGPPGSSSDVKKQTAHVNL